MKSLVSNLLGFKPKDIKGLRWRRILYCKRQSSSIQALSAGIRSQSPVPGQSATSLGIAMKMPSAPYADHKRSCHMSPPAWFHHIEDCMSTGMFHFNPFWDVAAPEHLSMLYLILTMRKCRRKTKPCACCTHAILSHSTLRQSNMAMGNHPFATDFPLFSHSKLHIWWGFPA